MSVLERITWLRFRHEVTRGTDPGNITATGGSTTTIVAKTVPADPADFTGSNDEWNGLYACCQTATQAANVGKVRKITNYVSGSGTATVEAFPATVTAADTFEICGFVAGTMDAPHFAYERISRDDYQRCTFDPPASAQGFSIGEFSFVCEASGLDQGAVTLETDSLHHLCLGGVGPLAAAYDTSLVDDPLANNTTTVFRITDTESANFAEGQIIEVADITGTTHECRPITALDASPVGYDTVTVSPPFSVAPTDGKVVRGTYTYVPAETWSSHDSFTFIVHENGQDWEFNGCKLTCSGLPDWSAGELPMLAFDVKADSNATPVANTPAFCPQMSSKYGPALIAGYIWNGTTALSSSGFSVDFGWTVSDQKAVSGRVQHRVTDRKSTGSVKLWNTAVAMPAALSGDPDVVLYTYGGTASTGFVGFYGEKAKVADLTQAAEEGIRTYERSLEFYDDATDASETVKPIFFRL